MNGHWKVSQKSLFSEVVRALQERQQKHSKSGNLDVSKARSGDTSDNMVKDNLPACVRRSQVVNSKSTQHKGDSVKCNNKNPLRKTSTTGSMPSSGSTNRVHRALRQKYVICLQTTLIKVKQEC